MDARTKAIGIITGGRVQALEDAGLSVYMMMIAYDIRGL
jgi:hypothetical protein